jgi:hypothetical protein
MERFIPKNERKSSFPSNSWVVYVLNVKNATQCSKRELKIIGVGNQSRCCCISRPDCEVKTCVRDNHCTMGAKCNLRILLLETQPQSETQAKVKTELASLTAKSSVRSPNPNLGLTPDSPLRQAVLAGRLAARTAVSGFALKICIHQCKSAAEKGFPLRSSVVQGFGSHNCNLDGKDAGRNNTKLLRGLNAKC